MFEFKMPSLGADMMEGTLTSWNVDVGDHIKRGEVLCEIETSKGAIDVEIWESGVVTSLKIHPGDNVPVGETIATLDLDGTGAQEKPDAPGESETPPKATTPEPEVKEPEVEEPEVETEVTEVEDEDPNLEPEVAAAELEIEPGSAQPDTPESDMPTQYRILASPAARRLAEQRGIDLSETRGTGVDGSITLADVEHAPDKVDGHRRISPLAKKMAQEHGIDLDSVQGHGPHGAVESSDVKALYQDTTSDMASASEKKGAIDIQSSMRAAIAVAMAKSKREIPHYYLSEEISMHRALAWLEERNAKASVSERILPAVLLIKAVALATQEVPEMNGIFENNAFTRKEDVNPGFAIALKGGGVIPPALFNADKKSLLEIMADLKDLVARVRRGKLRSSEVMDATITITSLGDLGVNAVYGVIYPPQVAIIGFGRITERVFVEEGMMGVKRGLTATLSGDHRVSDGIAGARFLAKIRDLLQTPENL